MALTDTQIRKAQPSERRTRLYDERGLYLEVAPTGGKWWRFKYRFAGKEKLLSLGTYPDTSLKLAREKRDQAREQVAASIDPGVARKAKKQSGAHAAADAFEAISREWFAVKQDGWSPGYAEKVIRRLEVDVFPWVGARRISELTPPELLAVLRRIEARGVIETAHRALESISQVFRYAVATGRAESNPARDLKDALRKPEPVHFPAITDPKRLGELLRAIDAYAGTPVVRAALKLAPMLLLRPGELRFAQWTEFDLDKAEWWIPGVRMKRKKREKLLGPPHLVPLPKQAVAVLKDLQPLTGGGLYVFRGERHHDRAMSENTVNAALRAMGFPADEVVGHGFRATARTLLHEHLGFDPDVIEAQLAHSVRDSLGRAYNRTEFIAQRRKMLQAWADHLDALRVKAITAS